MVVKKKMSKKKVLKKAPAKKAAPQKVAKKAPAKKAAAKKPAAKAKAPKGISAADFFDPDGEARFIVGPVRLAFTQYLSTKNDDDQFTILLVLPDTPVTVPGTNRVSAHPDSPSKMGTKMFPGLNDVVQYMVDRDFKGDDDGLTLPVKDGDESKSLEKYREVFGGNWVVNAKSLYRPEIVRRDLTLVDVEDVPAEARSGFWAMVSLTAFSYPAPGQKSKGNTGVSFQLNNIQIVAEDETFGGAGISAESEFAESNDWDDAEDAEYEEVEEDEDEEEGDEEEEEYEEEDEEDWEEDEG